MDISATTVISRPVDTVYAYAMNVENDAHWRTGITGSGWRSGEPLDVGKIGCTVAGDKEIEWRIISYKPGESVDWELLNGPFLGRGGYRFVPVEGGTQFTLVANVEPSGLYKLLGPLFARMGRRQNQADVEKLRNILEAMPYPDEQP
jgi:uncharacterized membrane protein